MGRLILVREGRNAGSRTVCIPGENGGRSIRGDERTSDLLVASGCRAALWILSGGSAQPGVLLKFWTVTAPWERGFVSAIAATNNVAAQEMEIPNFDLEIKKTVRREAVGERFHPRV